MEEEKARNRLIVNEPALHRISYHTMALIVRFTGGNPVKLTLKLGCLSSRARSKFRGTLLASMGGHFLGPALQTLPEDRREQTVLSFGRGLELFKRSMQIYRRTGFQKDFVNNSLVSDMAQSMKFLVEVVWLARQAYLGRAGCDCYDLCLEYLNGNLGVAAI